MGWARANIHLIDGNDVEYGSLRESIAIHVWRKRQRIELLNTIAVVVSNVNPEKAKKALNNLIEEQFPEQAFEREQAVDRALKIMESERNKSFAIAPIQKDKPKGLVRKVNKVLKRGS